MMRRWARAAGIATRLGNRTLRATGIPTYLKQGALENAAAMANRASNHTIEFYGRRRDDITLTQVERVRL